jgi:hypothetical protein
METSLLCYGYDNHIPVYVHAGMRLTGYSHIVEHPCTAASAGVPTIVPRIDESTDFFILAGNNLNFRSSIP